MADLRLARKNNATVKNLNAFSLLVEYMSWKQPPKPLVIMPMCIENCDKKAAQSPQMICGLRQPLVNTI